MQMQPQLPNKEVEKKEPLDPESIIVLKKLTRAPANCDAFFSGLYSREQLGEELFVKVLKKVLTDAEKLTIEKKFSKNIIQELTNLEAQQKKQTKKKDESNLSYLNVVDRLYEVKNLQDTAFHVNFSENHVQVSASEFEIAKPDRLLLESLKLLGDSPDDY